MEKLERNVGIFISRVIKTESWCAYTQGKPGSMQGTWKRLRMLLLMSRTVLDPDKYPFINTIGIRKEYFDTQWTSDFVIHFTDGRTGIRELTNKDGLSKRAAIEKLEFSRRYWSTTKVAEWKIVVMEKGEC